MTIVVLFENEHLSFLHKKVVGEQYMLLFFETFVVLELHLFLRHDISCLQTTLIVQKRQRLLEKVTIKVL